MANFKMDADTRSDSVARKGVREGASEGGRERRTEKEGGKERERTVRTERGGGE